MAATTTVINGASHVETPYDSLSRCRKYEQENGFLKTAQHQDFSVYTSGEDLNTQENANNREYVNDVSNTTIYVLLVTFVILISIACGALIYVTLMNHRKIVRVITKAQEYTPE